MLSCRHSNQPLHGKVMDDQCDEHRIDLIRSLLVWTPKRHKAIRSDARATNARQMIGQWCFAQGWEFVDQAILPDHSHLIVCPWSCVAATDVVKVVNGSTSHALDHAMPFGGSSPRSGPEALLRPPLAWSRKRRSYAPAQRTRACSSAHVWRQCSLLSEISLIT